MKVKVTPEKAKMVAQVISEKEINITLSPNEAAFIGCVIGDLNHGLIRRTVMDHQQTTFDCDDVKIIDSDFIYKLYDALKKAVGKY